MYNIAVYNIVLFIWWKPTFWGVLCDFQYLHYEFLEFNNYNNIRTYMCICVLVEIKQKYILHDIEVKTFLNHLILVLVCCHFHTFFL